MDKLRKNGNIKYCKICEKEGNNKWNGCCKKCDTLVWKLTEEALKTCSCVNFKKQANFIIKIITKILCLMGFHKGKIHSNCKYNPVWEQWTPRGISTNYGAHCIYCRKELEGV